MSGKWQPFCLSLNVLTGPDDIWFSMAEVLLEGFENFDQPLCCAKDKLSPNQLNST